MDRISIGGLEEITTNATIELDFVYEGGYTNDHIDLFFSGTWDETNGNGGTAISIYSGQYLGINCIPLGQTVWDGITLVDCKFELGRRYKLSVTAHYESGNTTINIYVDGKQVGTHTIYGRQLSLSIADSWIGCADIYSARIYNRALTAEEIYQNFAAIE